MNPLHLQTLSAIIDEESFEDAASILGVSPSAVSQRIKALEKEIGRVVVRRTSPPTPTDAGEILLQTARRMELLQAEANAQLHERIDRVPLTVAINADSLSEWFKPVLADVARWDSATLHVRVEDEAYSLALLKRGDVLGAVTGEAKAASGCESIALGHFIMYPWQTLGFWIVTQAGMELWIGALCRCCVLARVMRCRTRILNAGLVRFRAAVEFLKYLQRKLSLKPLG